MDNEEKYVQKIYELNLVLEDGKRVNVVDHGNRNKLQEDAETLSGFLGKPVWNAILLNYLKDEILGPDDDRI